MKTGLIVSHLGIALAAFAVGRFAFAPASSRDSVALPDEPLAAFAEAVQIPDSHTRAQALLDFFARTDPSWADDLRAMLDEPDSKLRLDEISEALFASWWAKSDPAAAFEHRVEPGWSDRHPWVREVMLRWVASDAASAALAADTLPPNVERGKLEATRVLVDHWWDNPVANDPTPLLALLEHLEVMPRAGAVQAVIQGLIAQRGVDGAEKFVESVAQQDTADVSLPEELLARFGQALVEIDVEHAKRWAAKHGEGRDGAGVLRHLAFSWGRKDGPAAMNWALNLPDTPQRPHVILRVWLSYRDAEPDRAAEWLMAQEPTGALEPIFRRYLVGTATLDAQKAISIVETAKDPAVRESLLAAVGIGWMKTDPEAAEKWLASVDLPAPMKEQVRKARALAGPPASPEAPN